MTDLATDVFHAIAQRYAARSADIAQFVATKYSFEEWLNWEAFAACATNAAWRLSPKPSYCNLGVADCKDYGDLLVGMGGSKVLVEIGLVHDGTGDKWRAKLDWDVQKLARPLTGVTTLHVVVLTSASDIAASDRWQRWLAKVPCWSRPTSLSASAALPPNGMLMVRGWL